MRRDKTIAIVDDDSGVRTSLASLLRSVGYGVSTYGSATEFLAGGATPDCMVVDIQMPAMRGDELQARLLATGRPVPMIFMTAFPAEPSRQRVLAAGAAAYLEKPIETASLIKCIEKIVG